MSHTHIKDSVHTQAPNDQHNIDTDESKKTSALASTHPNAKVAAARTPPRADALQQATREQVAASLAEIVSLNRPDRAAQKADLLLNMLPRTLRTPAALNNLEHAIKNEGKALTKLLHSAHDHYDNANKRLWFRSHVIQKLAGGATIAKAKTHADYLAARSKVVDSLKGVMKGQVLGVSAHAKARIIVDNLPDAVKTLGGMNKIQDKLDNNREEVRQLLHSFESEVDGRARRMNLRTELVKYLAEGATIEQAQARRDKILARESVMDILDGVIDQGDYETKREVLEAVYHRLPDDMRTTESLNRISFYYDDHQAYYDKAFEDIHNGAGDSKGTYVTACALLVQQIAQDAIEAEARAQAAARPVPLYPRPLIPTPVVAGAAFLDANQRGTPVTPMTLDYRGADCRNTIASIINGQGAYQDIRVADCGPKLEASGAGYLCADRILRTNAIVVFWENRNGEQNATLFNNAALTNPDQITSSLNGIDPNMRVHSFNWLKIEPAGQMANTIARANNENQTIIHSIANSYGAPLNHIDRPHLSELNPSDDPNKNPPSLSMVVDTQNAKIFITPTKTYSDAYFQTRELQLNAQPQATVGGNEAKPIEIIEEEPPGKNA